MMADRLAGKVALITGAAQGMGASHATVFVEEGASVVVADVQDDAAKALAERLGERAAACHLDVTDESSWADAVAFAERTFGGLDALVANAGIVRSAPIESTSLADFRSVIDVNLVGVFLGMRAVVPAMRRRGGGSIVNVASIDGFVALPNVASYNASKFGVRGLTKTGAVELGAAGIRVNAICPGAIDTPMTAPRQTAVGTIDPKASLTNVPLGRVGSPREVSLLAVYLASDESSFCTGGDFVIDGGWIAGPLEASLPPIRS
jgi:3alpha(or 20beta)-hydroxysteroid dehydrogenase